MARMTITEVLVPGRSFMDPQTCAWVHGSLAEDQVSIGEIRCGSEEGSVETCDGSDGVKESDDGDEVSGDEDVFEETAQEIKARLEEEERLELIGVVLMQRYMQRSIYRVGVYSLRTDCWKFTTFGSKHNTFHLQYYVPSICVGGVAYFPHSEGRIVCFDLHDERLSEVQLPAETLGRYFSWHCREISMQACGESIALMRIKDGFLEKWVLKNRYATDDHTWEAKTVTNIRTELASDYSMESSDVGAYMLRDTGRSCDLYLCGNPEITSQVDGFENYNLTQDLKVIDCHTANLLLLDEETLGPLFKEEEEETERSMLVLYSDVSREYYRRKYWPDKI